MCGIVGIYDRNGAPVEDCRGKLERAVEMIHHRGPDERGFWSKGRIGLGMARLSIIAPQGNHQPAKNEDGTVRVVFNGQVYNHPSLMRSLQARGHQFTAAGDTEVLAHAYEEWGVGFLEQLNGMYGMAIYDGREGGSILIARDRIGIKPLYYYLDDDRLIFGSEVKTILALMSHTPAVNPEGVVSLLTFEYIYPPHTLFRGIKKLEPGHYLKVDGDRVEHRAYWELPRERRPLSLAQACAELRELMDDAVSARMISDVPLGAFLSGGIDSSIIVGLMARHSDRPIKTFCVGFEDATYNEAPYARLVADRYTTEHYEITLRLNLDELWKPVELILDDPIGDFSVFSTYLVSRAARDHVTVVLSGDGGDELFGGYDTYVAERLARYYQLLGPTMTQRVLPKLLGAVRPSPAKKGLINRAKVFVAGAARSRELRHTRWMVFMDERLRQGLFTEAFAETAADVDPTQHVAKLMRQMEHGDLMEQGMYVDTAFYLPDNILHKVDRTSMATSLETRVPFLDHRVVESALTTPGRHRVQGFKRKALLKRAFAEVLPEPILHRGKEGFSTPMKHWLRGPLKPLMMDMLSGARIRRDGFFKTETVERLKEEHLAERNDHAHVLWSLILLCMWLDRYQHGGQPTPSPNPQEVAVR
jgi:asparagine synthase (glutamine-hydrolysing)